MPELLEHLSQFILPTFATLSLFAVSELCKFSIQSLYPPESKLRFEARLRYDLLVLAGACLTFIPVGSTGSTLGSLFGLGLFNILQIRAVIHSAAKLTTIENIENGE